MWTQYCFRTEDKPWATQPRDDAYMENVRASLPSFDVTVLLNEPNIIAFYWKMAKPLEDLWIYVKKESST